MVAWIQAPIFKQFFLQNDIAEDIKRCHQAIDSFLVTFNLTSHMETHKLVVEGEEKRQEDHQELVAYLSEMKHSGEITQQATLASAAEIREFMAYMQQVGTSAFFSPVLLLTEELLQKMGVYPVGDYRHRGLQQNLYSVQKSTGELLPKVELEHGEVRRVSTNPVGGSAAFDIWVGEYLGVEKCAIKVVRGIEVSPKIRDVSKLTLYF